MATHLVFLTNYLNQPFLRLLEKNNFFPQKRFLILSEIVSYNYNRAFFVIS